MAQLPSFKKIIVSTGDDQLDRVINMIQDNIQLFASSVVQQVTPPVQLTGVALQPGLNIVPHTLGKPLNTWKMTSCDSQADLWDNQASSDIATLPSVYLYLNSSAACTVNLEVT